MHAQQDVFYRSLEQHSCPVRIDNLEESHCALDSVFVFIKFGFILVCVAPEWLPGVLGVGF